MSLVAWPAVGWLAGLLLEPLARRLAGEQAVACASCRSAEPGSRFSALVRALGPAGPRCRSCGSWSICWLAALGPGLALVFGLLASRWPFGPKLIATSLYAAVLLLVAILDLRHRLVYPLLVYPATFVAIALTPLALDQPLWSGLAGALAGAAIFF